MKASNLFPSPFLKKEDFPAPEILTIKRVSMETVAKGEEKPIIFFNEKVKGMVLNKTKTKLLETSYGDDTDDWVGKKVRLSSDPDVRDLAGNVVGGIRLEVTKAKPGAKVKPVEVVPEDTLDNEVPF